MQQLDEFVLNYDCLNYHMLPKFIKRRVDALKKIQLEHIKIQQKFHQELQDLELKYEKLYQPLYDKRSQIVSGEYEPTDEECQLPPNILENEFNGDQENEDGKQEMIFDEEQEKAIKPKVKGIPGFWLGCLVSTYNFNDSIEEYDRPVLKFLRDVKLVNGQVGDDITYKLEFYFDENPHFTNNVLTKTYFLKSKPDEKDPFSYDGYEVYKSEGCEINWHPNKDITQKTVTVKQRNKSNGVVREKKKTIERESFFYFFKSNQAPENEEEMDEDLTALIGIDFTLGEVLRHSIIPKAALYYFGYMLDGEDDDEDDEEEEEDEDDSEDSEDSRSRSNSEYDESESDSNDSLNAKDKDKKKLMPSKKSPKNEKSA